MEIIDILVSNDIGYLLALKNAQPLPSIPPSCLPATVAASSVIEVKSKFKLPTWVWVVTGVLGTLAIAAVYNQVQIQKTQKNQQS